MSTTFYILGSTLLVSAISLIGVILFSFHEGLIKKCILYFVSFSTGALLGDVFIHMIPEMIEVHGEYVSDALLFVLLGVVLSFIIEKIIHWRHCHSLDCDEHIHPMGMVNLIGDAVHNLIDGMLIAGSYLVSIPVGIATTVAVALHEIPQEIGDFAILLHSGYDKKRAILFNVLSASIAFVGAVAVLLGSSSLPAIGTYLLPLTAGNFLYIAGSDLIPELHKETSAKNAFLQLLCMVLGIGLMYMLSVSELA